MPQGSFDYEELLRPQIRGRSRYAERYGGGPSLLSQLRGFAKGDRRSSTGPRTRYDVGETPWNSRRAVVKSHYVPMARGGRLAAARHLAYLERDEVERDGSPGRLSGADESFDREAFGAPLEGEKRQFRFIVSPEDADGVDLQAFARELVAQMEKDLGRRLVWAAVNRETAVAQARAAAEDTKKALAFAVAEAATASAKRAAGAQWWKWAACWFLAATGCIAMIGHWEHSNGRSEGYANGREVARELYENAAAAASWANTPEGQLGYGLAKAGSLRELATCSGRGWVERDGVCYAGGKTRGWRLSAGSVER